ncbi:helix-turn-helix transcriptional regulator [Halorubellus sp. JP-L1]|uniref:winged helix-turn-helix domain-containing protein n=1 Tax=Halorubellus sp. JP-L1 TaxID=2715753 RepID=UPI0014091242|nr:helix-turn-helix domain-containing protein [Halorubellus sp. JP-L1]NHN42855.1 helix-turn-helix transcriptional regulator [Halorubellus sp. JP-L1]
MTEEYVDRTRLSLVPSRSNETRTATDVDRESSTDDDDPPVSAVLRSLDDDKCRAILATLDEPKSATELCDECDLSSSTVYRKLERLRDAALVKEYTEVRSDGPNATLYERHFTDVSISIDGDEFAVSIDRPAEDPEERLATFWSEMRRES